MAGESDSGFTWASETSVIGVDKLQIPDQVRLGAHGRRGYAPQSPRQPSAAWNCACSADCGLESVQRTSRGGGRYGEVESGVMAKKLSPSLETRAMTTAQFATPAIPFAAHPRRALRVPSVGRRARYSPLSLSPLRLSVSPLHNTTSQPRVRWPI